MVEYRTTCFACVTDVEKNLLITGEDYVSLPKISRGNGIMEDISKLDRALKKEIASLTGIDAYLDDRFEVPMRSYSETHLIKYKSQGGVPKHAWKWQGYEKIYNKEFQQSLSKFEDFIKFFMRKI